MRKAMLALCMLGSLAGCCNLDAQRVKEERVALDEWKKVLPIVEKSDLTEAEKNSWRLFAKSQEFRVHQEEEAVK